MVRLSSISLALQPFLANCIQLAGLLGEGQKPVYGPEALLSGTQLLLLRLYLNSILRTHIAEGRNHLCDFYRIHGMLLMHTDKIKNKGKKYLFKPSNGDTPLVPEAEAGRSRRSRPA